MPELIQHRTSWKVETLLEQAMKACVQDGASFAVWKLPGSTAIYFASGAEIRVHDVNLEETTPGFLFAPFDPGEKKIFLPATDLFIVDGEQLKTPTGSLPERLAQKEKSLAESHTPTSHIRPLKQGTLATPEKYNDLVRKCQEAVIAGAFEKLVPSRSKEVELHPTFDAAKVFLKLTNRYPSAMVSVFSSPEIGTWIGATPEMLVSVDANQHFRTAAVAGTQPYVPGTDLKTVTWTQKEIEEQALVERYIISCFKKIRLREFDEHGPRTVIAGNVVHLKTEFEVDMAATRYPQLGSVMLQLLHPTSAVCGMPMESSLAFLKTNEGYPREFYSGYLGPVKINRESQLFVNLRCMQLSEGKARLYAGGGVLGDSDPDKEWAETELKMNTLLSVIRD